MDRSGFVAPIALSHVAQFGSGFAQLCAANDEYQNPVHWPHGQESLKVQNVEFDITEPPCKLYIEYLMLKINMRPYNSMQMSIRCKFSMYCIPNIT